jgi:hypothetical protein
VVAQQIGETVTDFCKSYADLNPSIVDTHDSVGVVGRVGACTCTCKVCDFERMLNSTDIDQLCEIEEEVVCIESIFHRQNLKHWYLGMSQSLQRSTTSSRPLRRFLKSSRAFVRKVRTLAVRRDACTLNTTTIHHQDLAQTCNQDAMHFPKKPPSHQPAESAQSDL